MAVEINFLSCAPEDRPVQSWTMEAMTHVMEVLAGTRALFTLGMAYEAGKGDISVRNLAIPDFTIFKLNPLSVSYLITLGNLRNFPL